MIFKFSFMTLFILSEAERNCASFLNRQDPLTPAFFKKVKKIFFAGEFTTILEEKMKDLWVEQKKHDLEMLDFMLILEY